MASVSISRNGRPITKSGLRRSCLLRTIQSPNSVRHEICQRGVCCSYTAGYEEKTAQLGKAEGEGKGEAAAPVVRGFKYVRLVGTLLQALHEAGTERDRAGNRQLFYDQYATLLLLYFFTPTVTSLRGIQQLSELAKVQQRWGVRRTALSSLSEAATVFDAALLQDVISELALRAWTQATPGNPAVGRAGAGVVAGLGGD